MSRAVLPILLTVLGLTAASCAAESDGPASKQSSGCGKDQLSTYQSGKITIATDSPAYAPWYQDNKPSNGKGFESAVSFAVAKQLGFASQDVTWTVARFEGVIAPTPKKWDFDANQFSITQQRAKAVDFSSPYYNVTQAVVTLKSSSFAKAKSVADLKSAKLGGQRGTTSFDAISSVIKPSASPAGYPTNDLAVQALKNGTIDGLVVDLPTGFYVTSAQVDDATIVGQLPDSGKQEQFGLVLPKDSALTTCVSKAVDALRKNGTLAQLEKKWLTGAGAPKLS